MSLRRNPSGFVALLCLLMSAAPARAELDKQWIADAQGCLHFNPNPLPNESLSWTGGCTNGYASGNGTLTWMRDGQTTSTYTGTWQGGKPQGLVTATWPNGNRFEGQMVDGLRSGMGRFQWADGGFHEGNYSHGAANGRGVRQWASGERYEGEFVSGLSQGQGKTTLRDGTLYEGEYKNGRFWGSGVMRWTNGSRYQGSFVDGQMSGKGVLERADGVQYSGEFANGKPSGQGSLRWGNGKRYTGSVSAGQPHGQGAMDYANGDRHVGEYLAGVATGKGVYKFKDGQQVEAVFANGKPNGAGTAQLANGLRYEGEFKDGRPDGTGRFYRASNEVLDKAELDAANRALLNMAYSGAVSSTYTREQMNAKLHCTKMPPPVVPAVRWTGSASYIAEGTLIDGKITEVKFISVNAPNDGFVDAQFKESIARTMLGSYECHANKPSIIRQQFVFNIS